MKNRSIEYSRLGRKEFNGSQYANRHHRAITAPRGGCSRLPRLPVTIVTPPDGVRRNRWRTVQRHIDRASNNLRKTPKPEAQLAGDGGQSCGLSSLSRSPGSTPESTRQDPNLVGDEIPANPTERNYAFPANIVASCAIGPSKTAPHTSRLTRLVDERKQQIFPPPNAIPALGITAGTASQRRPVQDPSSRSWRLGRHERGVEVPKEVFESPPRNWRVISNVTAEWSYGSPHPSGSITLRRHLLSADL